MTKLAHWRKRTFIALGLLLAVTAFFLFHGYSHLDARQDAKASILILRWDNPAEESAVPAGIAVDSNGHLYIADSKDRYIQDLGPAGSFIAKLSAGGEDQLDGPYGVAVDGESYVYVADFGKGHIQKFDPEGNLIAEWENEGHDAGLSMDADALSRHIHKLAEEIQCQYMLVAIRDD